MNVTVTGSSGFIGAATVARLESAGHTVTRFDRTLDLDVRDPDNCDQAIEGADAVIHLAGVLGTSELFDQVQRAISINVAGTANVLDACRRHGAAYVGITMPDCWPSLYQATKLCGVRIAEAYHHAHGVPVTHVRAFNAYGPGQAHGPGHPQKIIPTFAWHASRGLPMPIWGDGSQTVDLVHVDWIAKMLADCATHDLASGLTFDAGSGQEMSVINVARYIGAIFGSTLVEFLPMRAGELEHTKLCAREPGWFGFAKALDRLGETALGYAPEVIEAAA